MSMKLIEHDYQLIRVCKSSQTDWIKRFKEILAEMFALVVEDISVHDINNYLLELAKKLNLLGSEYHFKRFIFDLSPKRNFYYTCNRRPELGAETVDFDIILLSRLDSLFALTKAEDIPGYKEYMDGFKASNKL